MRVISRELDGDVGDVALLAILMAIYMVISLWVSI